jgi:hypothetical protein
MIEAARQAFAERTVASPNARRPGPPTASLRYARTAAGDAEPGGPATVLSIEGGLEDLVEISGALRRAGVDPGPLWWVGRDPMPDAVEVLDEATAAPADAGDARQALDALGSPAPLAPLGDAPGRYRTVLPAGFPDERVANVPPSGWAWRVKRLAAAEQDRAAEAAEGPAAGDTPPPGRTVVTAIRCLSCGNGDPARFHRIYVEASRERIVDGDWTVETSWEFEDGLWTHTACEACGSGAVEEEIGTTAAPSRLAGATAELAEAIHAAPGPLSLLEDDPERGLVRVSRDDGGPFCETYTITTNPEAQP